VPTSPQSHTYSSQRLQLHYVQWGDAGAPPLLLLHGGRDHCRSWDWVAGRLCSAYRVIAPDLRGHGDSAWSPDGDYSMFSYVQDLAELVETLQLAPLRIVAHSLGGNIAIRYSGLYPASVARLVAIEGLGPSPQLRAEREAVPLAQRLRRWMELRRSLAAGQKRRHASFEDALARMQAANAHLSAAQALHLTTHGLGRNADGSYSWKFDDYVRSMPPVDLSQAETVQLWSAITCPTLLCYGANSWASNPATDGRAAYFGNARVSLYPDAGHWLHHDQFERFMQELSAFL
jgi:pimeloyl-ACP methyl ester carboxylesterase